MRQLSSSKQSRVGVHGHPEQAADDLTISQAEPALFRTNDPLKLHAASAYILPGSPDGRAGQHRVELPPIRVTG
jgi:hypothetical protein